jgi:hypothetical protein
MATMMGQFSYAIHATTLVVHAATNNLVLLVTFLASELSILQQVYVYV